MEWTFLACTWAYLRISSAVGDVVKGGIGLHWVRACVAVNPKAGNITRHGGRHQNTQTSPHSVTSDDTPVNNFPTRHSSSADIRHDEKV